MKINEKSWTGEANKLQFRIAESYRAKLAVEELTIARRRMIKKSGYIWSDRYTYVAPVLAVIACLAVVLRIKGTNFSPVAYIAAVRRARARTIYNVGVVTSLNENLIFPKGEQKTV